LQTARGDLLAGLSVQARVIRALMLREVLTRYGRHNIGFLWIFLENLLFTAAVVGFWAITHQGGVRGLDIVAFAVLGYSFVLLWRNTVNRVVKAMEPNRTLLYHRQVKVVDIYLARIALELTASTGSFLFVYGLLFTFGLMAAPRDPALMLGGWLVLMLVAASLGLLVGPWSELSEMLERVWHIMTYLLFPLSGAFIALQWLPPVARDFFLAVPLVHAIEMIRGGYFGEAYRAHYNLPYVAAMSLLSSLIGLLLMRRVESTMVVE
jgi:capsular polysaccharide transport system permease protein